jgi:hypothetical protein
VENIELLGGPPLVGPSILRYPRYRVRVRAGRGGVCILYASDFDAFNYVVNPVTDEEKHKNDG